MIYDLPPILTGSPQQQLTAMRDYLVRLSQELRLSETALERKTQAAVTAASAGGVSRSQLKKEADSLRSLIVSTAETISANIEAIETELHSDYLAQSDFGTYQEYAEGRFTQTASDIDELYSYSQSVNTDLVNYKSSIQGEIRRGVITDPDSGEQCIGIAISQKLLFDDGGVPYVDRQGIVYPRLSSAQTFGLYTSSGWQYWINGQKVGWFDSADSSLHLRTVTVNEAISMGPLWQIAIHPGEGLGLRYLG